MINSIDAGEISRSLDQELAPEYAGRILFNSFRFSQGDPVLQHQIFAYLHEIRPNWRIDVPQEEALKATAKKLHEHVAVGARPAGERAILHTMIESTDFGSELDSAISWLKKTFSGEPIGHYNGIRFIVDKIITRDANYLLYTDGGRPRTFHRPDLEKSEMGDPWLSHAIYYGIEGHTTGIPEYDQMFHELGDYINNVLSEKDQILFRKFNGVKKVYEGKSLHSTKPAG
jgi:hypothetical protein